MNTPIVRLKPLFKVRRGFVGRVLRALPLLVLVALLQQCGGGGNRDYLVVIDTSGSMARDQLIEQVKGGVKRLLDETIADGDTVALYTFDETLRNQGRFPIGQKDARTALMAAVAVLKPLPKNTDMVRLILNLRDESRAAEKAGREQVVVILSDGEDAPDPRAPKRQRLDIGRFRAAEKFPVQEKYIYYVALRNQDNARVIAGLEGTVGGRVTAVKVAMTKDGSPAPGGAASAVASIGGDLKERDYLKFALAYWPYAAGALGLLLLILLILFLLARFRAANQPEGFLLYYEDGIQSPMKSTLRLDRVQSNRFGIGPSTGADFRVRGLGVSQVVTFFSKREKDRCRLKPSGGSQALVQAIGQKEPGFFQFGDRFKIGNYIFEYSETQE